MQRSTIANLLLVLTAILLTTLVLLLFGWAAMSTPPASCNRALKTLKSLQKSFDANTTSKGAPQKQKESVSRRTKPLSESAAQEMPETGISRPPKPFKPRDGYQRLCCDSFTDRGFDDEDLLKYMYGEQFNSNDTSGWGEIVVLGNQNSGTHPHVSSPDAIPATS